MKVKVSKLRIFIYSIYLKIKHLLISFKNFNEFHLGDKVIYNGMDFIIFNGTRSDGYGNRLLSIALCGKSFHGQKLEYHVPECDIRHKFCFNSIKNRLFSHYRWWRNYWYTINLGEMVEAYIKKKAGK